MSTCSTIQNINQLLAASDISYTNKPIEEELMQSLFMAEGKKAGNPEFDPSLHDFDADNSFWLGCTDRSGNLIATVAARLLNADSFVETCRSYAFWYGEKIRFTESLNIVFSNYERLPSRRAAFIGAGWVRPDWRGRGISWALTRLANYTALTRWQPDWVVGMSLSGVTQAGVPAINFGFPRIDLFATGFRLLGFSRQQLFLLTMTREEGAAVAAADLSFLESRPHLCLDSRFGDQLRAQRRSRNDNASSQPAIRAAG